MVSMFSLEKEALLFGDSYTYSEGDKNRVCASLYIACSWTHLSV